MRGRRTSVLNRQATTGFSVSMPMSGPASNLPAKSWNGSASRPILRRDRCPGACPILEHGSTIPAGIRIVKSACSIDLLHFPYRDWDDHLRRIDRYTQTASDAAHAAGKRGNPLMLLAGPPISFIRTFFLRLGFMDGWRGALIAYAGARYVFLRELRILR